MIRLISQRHTLDTYRLTVQQSIVTVPTQRLSCALELSADKTSEKAVIKQGKSEDKTLKTRKTKKKTKSKDKHEKLSLSQINCSQKFSSFLSCDGISVTGVGQMAWKLRAWGLLGADGLNRIDMSQVTRQV